MLIAVLVTYALLAKRSEAVAWWACGQSVYRLMLPGLIFALTAAAGAWLIQEKLMPASNIQQDALRAQIRGSAARATTRTGRQWLASAESNRLYSYEYDEQHRLLSDLTIYDFDSSGVHLTGMTSGQQGSWTTPTTLAVTRADSLAIRGLELTREQKAQLELKGDRYAGCVQTWSRQTLATKQPRLEGLFDCGEAARSGRLIACRSAATKVRRTFQHSGDGISGKSAGAFIWPARNRDRAPFSSGCESGLLGSRRSVPTTRELRVLPPAVAGWAPPIIFAAGGTYFLSRIELD